MSDAPLPYSSPASKRVTVLLALTVLTLLLAFASCSFGAYKEAGPMEVLRVLAREMGVSSRLVDPQQSEIILMLRLPRVALALMAGAALAMSGAALQGLFRNPLADPALVGVSGGAALGAVAFIVIGGAAFGGLQDVSGAFALPVAAMAGGIAVTFVIYNISKVEGRTHLSLVLLTGLAFNALAGAGVGMFEYLSTDAQLREMTFWSLGSLSKAGWLQIGAAAVFILPAMLLMLFLSRPLNALLLGEAEAFHLGVPVQKIKRLVIVLSAAMAGASVAVCGTIGFLGLVAPHLVRLAVGPDHRLLLPASALLGASLLLAADLAARFLGGGLGELPVGIVTALFGAPVFLALLLRARRSGGF